MASERETPSTLPADQNSWPIQVLAPDDANVTVATAASGSTSAAAIGGLATNRPNIIELSSISDIHVVFGASGVGVAAASTSRFFAKGAAIYKLLPTQTHFRVIQAAGSSGGVVTITPMI